MPSVFRTSAQLPVFWDSSVCLSCHFKQLRIYRNLSPARTATTSSTSASRLRNYSTSNQRRGFQYDCSKTQNQGEGVKTRRWQLQARSLTTSSSYTREAASQHRANAPISYHLDSGSIRSSAPGASNRVSVKKQDIRKALKAWQPAPDYVPPATPKEIVLTSLDYERGINNLTRPEDLGGCAAADQERFDPALTDSLQDFNRITDVSDGASIAATILKKGDLVELRSSVNTAMLAVFLGASENSYFQFYTMYGRLYTASYRTPKFQVDQYFTHKELEPIMPYIPKATDEDTMDEDVTIPRDAAAPVLKKLIEFRDASEAFCRQYTPELEGVFELLAHPTEIRYMALEDIVSTLTKIPLSRNKPHPPELMFAISNALMSDTFGFSFEQRTYSSSLIIRIEPKENAAIVTRVHKWLRAFQEEAAVLASGGREVPYYTSRDAAHVKHFVRKCRQLIAESRELRRASPDGLVISCNKGTETPSTLSGQDVVHSLEFSNTDRDFIRVLKLSALSTALRTLPTHKTLANSIIRAVDPEYNTKYSDPATWNLLVEIGVVDPCDHGEGFDTEAWPANQKLDREITAVESQLAAGVTLEQAANLTDSMEAFRKDWGDLPVLCIDAAETHEIDDGVSLEEIPEEPGNYWVRVHVSHLSAFTSPAHLLGRRGEHKITSMYLETGAASMLPSWVGKHFSVGPNSPVLTFSAKLNSDGDMLDYDVRPGTVRNVIFTTPELINETFGDAKTNITRNDIHVNCGQFPEVPLTEATENRPISSPTEEHMSILRTLDAVLDKVKSKRGKSRMMNFNSVELLDLRVNNPFSSSNTHPSNYSHQENSESWKAARVAVYSNPTHAMFSLRDPPIQMAINQNFDEILALADADKGRAVSDTIVEQAMLLAGIVGAKWAAARNIPIIFSGTRPAVEGLDAVTELARGEIIEEGAWNREIIGQIISLYAIRHLSSYPVPQRLMNMTEYTKITSPLRRFTDLVSTWQIDAALREEHRTGVSLVGRPDVHAPYLPYQRAGMDKVIRFVNYRQQEIQWWQRAHRKHWQIQAIGRAFYLGEAKLPERMTCLLRRTKMRDTRVGLLRELEVQARVEWKPTKNEMGEVVDDVGPKVGEIWEVEMTDVDLYTRDIRVQAIRKVE